MKLHRRIVACLLCLVMVVGLFPASIQAAEGNTSINFLDSKESSKFEIKGGSAAIVDGVGLKLVSTANAGPEPAKQNKPVADEDTVYVPATGDYTATLKFAFNENGSGGAYEFFAFYGWQDTNNMAGIRGGDGAIQDFIMKNGSITEEVSTTTPGLKNNGTYHWLRLVKKGDTIACYRSTDGENFGSAFVTHDVSGFTPAQILIDAYSGSATGYTYTLEYLYFGEDTGSMHEYAVKNAAEALVAQIPETAPINVANYYQLPKSILNYSVSYSGSANVTESGVLTAVSNKEVTEKITVTVTGPMGKTASKEVSIKVPAKDSSDIPEVSWVVVLDWNDGSGKTTELKLADGEKITVPEYNRPGYRITRWTTSRSSGGWGQQPAAYDMNTPVTRDLTLYANWEKDWSKMYSLAEEYSDYFPFGTFGTESPGSGQTEREYCTYSGNDGKMTYNFDVNGSRSAYNSAVQAINADSSLSAEEKAAKIKEAEGKVKVNLSSGLRNALQSIQNWNRNHPEGPKKYYRQHVIAWHGSEQNQNFYHLGFNTSNDWATPEIMNARLDSYIEEYFKLCEPYKDVILSWDIVNEALDCYTGMVRNHDDSSSQQGEWGHIYRYKKDGKAVGLDVSQEELDERLRVESEWIRVAFASARKWATELGCDWKLYYNDYQDSNKLYEPKLHNTIKVLQPIYEAGNIDGYGMQARVAFACPTADFIAEHIDLGLTVADEFSFSEADFRSDFIVNPIYDASKPTRRVTSADGDSDWNAGGSGRNSAISQNNGNTYDVWNSPVRRNPNFNNSNIDMETKKLQADYVADIMDHVLERRDKCGAIAIDGTNDGSTFNNGTGCQLWDTSGNEKPSFFAAIGAPNRLKMREAIAKGPDSSKKSQYTDASWKKYDEAKKAAEALVDVRIYDADGVEAVKTATAELNAAIDGLKRGDGTPCKHESTEVKDAKEATCGAAGYTGDTYCKDCGEKLATGKEVPATGKHTEEVKNAKEATCTEAGYTGDTVCKVCGAELSKGKATPAAGHKWGDWTVTKPATETEEGEKTRSCTKCDAKETEKIPATGVTPPTPVEFEDVKNDKAFYYESVYWAVGKGITAGTDKTHFSPDAKCTRGQAVTFLWRAAGSPEVEGVENPFVDIKETDFYYKAVLWAVKSGVTTGLDATHFGPDNKLTRGQFVTFLWRAKGAAEVTSDKEFTDVPASKYCAKAVAWAVESDITAGTDATHFSPDAKCTRGQVVTFLARAYK